MATGHKSPDTDSICLTICYTNLKRAIAGDAHIPARAGHMNGEARFALDYLGVEEPKPAEGVRTQVKGIEIRRARGVADNISLKKTWNVMQENNVVTTSSVRPDGTLEGLITVGDITKTHMNMYDSSISSRAHTQYSNIIEILETDIVVGDADVYFDKGKVLIAAANPDPMEFYIESHDLVILGNHYESQFCAIGMGADCTIVCEGAGASMTIEKIAQDRGCTVIATTYDIYTAARLINQSMSTSYFMTREHLITFNSDGYTDEIREVMVNKQHRDFPILDKEGRYLGMISRWSLLGTKGKRAILVGHNEKSQAVVGTESAEIMEIISHHRLGTVQTMAPVFFRNQPLGCTATIIYQMYLRNKVDIRLKIAGFLCSAIVLDTLLLRSPTCTPADEMAVRSLAAIVGLDIEKYAMEMFRAGSNLKDKSDGEIFYQDFKRFSVGKALVGVGQIASLNDIELETLKGKMPGYTEKAEESNSLNMAPFMLTSILKESTDLICYGQGVVQPAARAFHLGIEEITEKPGPALGLPGMVSRKKQLILEPILAGQDQDNGPVGQED